MYKYLSIILLVCSQMIFASSPPVFQEANQLFSDANKFSLENPQKAADAYQQALLRYQLALKDSETGAVHYNLGNCYFRLGDNGNAIYHYRKALQFDPLNEDFAHNLNYVRTLVNDEFEKGQLNRIVSAVVIWSKLPLTLQTIVLFLALSSFFYLKALQLYNPAKNYPRAAHAALFIAAMFILSNLIAINNMNETSDGVIITQELTARQGDGLIYEPAFSTKLHSGTEFKLLESRDEWLHVQLPDDSKCWIKSNEVKLW